ncbi:hypothetical protein [Streptomyces lydicus]|uniref:hypothetical protein n=1 Tax=Streptomyces lydicus TaxID=47763 RepID=UPI0036E4A2F4
MGNARNELRNVICSQAIGEEGAEQKIDAHRDEVLLEAAEKLDRIGHGAAAWILKDMARGTAPTT